MITIRHKYRLSQQSTILRHKYRENIRPLGLIESEDAAAAAGAMDTCKWNLQIYRFKLAYASETIINKIAYTTPN